MNILTNYPHVSLVTTNPATDSVVRESAQRPVVPATEAIVATPREPAVASEREKVQAQQVIASNNPTYEMPSNNSAQETEQAAKEESAQQEQQEQEQADKEEQQTKDTAPEQYDEQEQQKIDELKKRDTEVQVHEQAHVGAGGQYAGSPSYSYETGPDGKKYAVSGEVSIDTSKVPNDPQATLVKAQQIKRAALAPADPSSQDRSVAAKAEQMASTARQEVLAEMRAIGEDDEENKISKGKMQSDSQKQYSDLAADEQFQQTLLKRNQHINSFYHGASQAKPQAAFSQQA